MHIGGGFVVVLQLLAAAHALQQAGAAGTACSVATPDSRAFLACLEDPGATDILIQQDLHVGDVLFKYAGADAAPLQLDRYGHNSTTAAWTACSCGVFCCCPDLHCTGTSLHPVFHVSHHHAGTSRYRGPSTRSLTIGRCWISG